MNYDAIIEKAKEYLKTMVSDIEDPKTYCFHDHDHTKDVVEATQEMAAHYQLSAEDTFVVTCAAYFHDIGYLFGGAKNHEQRSANIAVEFLKKEGIGELVRQKVQGCIMATQMPQSPNNLLESIICDADLFHLGTISFAERNKLMHQEAECIKGGKIDKNTWRILTLQLLEYHQYHTDYARSKLNAEKEKNFQAMQEKQKKNAEKKYLEDEKSKKPERGIETMFRVTSSNSQRLSDMADNKANILLTVNSIILSMIVAVLLKALDNNVHLIVPTVLLMTFAVTTMVLAILATIPKIPAGRFSPEDVNGKNVNLLFFGNFYKTQYDEYQDAMNKAMDDKDFLYGMLTKDVYSQGVVLGRKYKLLRYAYGVFMFGLVISVAAFCIAIIVT